MTNMEVPRLFGAVSELNPSDEGESILLDFALLEVVHINVDAIYADVSFARGQNERRMYLLLACRWTSSWWLELVQRTNSKVYGSRIYKMVCGGREKLRGGFVWFVGGAGSVSYAARPGLGAAQRD